MVKHSSHFELSDTEFERQFTEGLLDPGLFNHEAHLRLAWLHIHKYGIDAAIKKVCTQLKAYVKALGASDKYNETLTIAAIRAVYHFKLKSETVTFKDFIIENPRLKINFKELMGQHYKTDIFNSVVAKERFLEPELLAFD